MVQMFLRQAVISKERPQAATMNSNRWVVWFFSHQVDIRTDCCIDSAERSTISITEGSCHKPARHDSAALGFAMKFVANNMISSRAVSRYICMASLLRTMIIGNNSKNKSLCPMSLMFPFGAFYNCQSRLAMLRGIYNCISSACLISSFADAVAKRCTVSLLHSYSAWVALCLGFSAESLEFIYIYIYIYICNIYIYI